MVKFDVGEFCGRGLRSREFAVVTDEKGEGRRMVGVHVVHDAGFEGIGHWVSGI